MDANMMDVDISFDVDPGIEAAAMQAEQTTPQVEEGQIDDDDDAPMPAAYFEALDTFRPMPEFLNLQGVNDLGPNEPLDWALEHCPDRRPKQLRWVNDTSVNLEYYNPEEAADALFALTHPDAGDPAFLPAQTSRKAQTYSQKPNSALVIREANIGDQKAKGSANRSDYYKKNPQAREEKRERGRRKSQPQYLDYDDDGGEQNGRRIFDEAMYDDGGSSPQEASRGRLTNNREIAGNSREVDSYRPRSDSPRESRFGRLRGRSASPASEEDGRFGFAEAGTSNHQYRSRSRGDQRRRSRSRERISRKRGSALETERWEKDRFVPSDTGRRTKNSSNAFSHKTDMGSNHRRSDATDETRNKGSLLSRMTKDGKPLVPTRSLADRITRGGSLADRVTRGDSKASNYGRLKDDDSAPREDSFQEPIATRRDLASRITWTRDRGGNGRSPSQDNGFSIRGSAPQSGGFSIRGAAGGE